MRLLRPVLACLLASLPALPFPAAAGVISGTVRAEGQAGTAGGESGGGNYGSRRYKFLERVDYEDMGGFVVHVDQPVAAPKPASRPRARIVQRDGAFEPHVLPVAAGTAVEFPNEDDIFHNVFSMSETTPFDLGLYRRGEPAKQIVFEAPGRIDLFCSIHTKMNCIVLVLPNAWFTVADARGRWTLPELPAGTYRVRAWHERLPARTMEVTVPAEGEVKVDFVLGLQGLPKR